MKTYYLYVLKLGGGGTMRPVNFTLPDGFSLSVYKPNLLGLVKCKNSFRDLAWKWLSFSKCWIYQVRDIEGNLAHKSLMIGPNFKFPFLKKGEFEIGPCFTSPKHRGKGIYPYVLQAIASSRPESQFMMLVEERNESSIKGIEKAGFTRTGNVARRKWGRWVRL